MKSRMTGLSLLITLLTWFLFAASVSGNETAVAVNPPDRQHVVEAKGEEGLEPDRIFFMA